MEDNQDLWQNRSAPDAPKAEAEPSLQESAPSHTDLDADLDAMTQEDIQPKALKKRGHGLSRLCNRLIVLAACGVLCWSLYQLGVSLWGYGRADTLYETASDSFYAGTDKGIRQVTMLSPSPAPVLTMDYEEARNHQEDEQGEDPSAPDISYSEEFELLRANLLNMKRKYPDLYGWIRVDGTKIDYPIMAYRENNYYLNHAYTGDYVPAGSIFCDSFNGTRLLDDRNLVLYGHNMKNGTMFSNIDKYFNEEFFFGEHLITVTTTDGIYTYRVFSVMVSNMNSKYNRVKFSTVGSFENFCREMQSLSAVQGPAIDFQPDDHIITLSTCTPSGGNWRERYVLMGILIKEEHGAF